EMATEHLNSLPATGLKRAVLDLARDDFLAWLQAQGQPPLRARQIRRWLVTGRAETFESMTDLPRDLRAALAADFEALGSRIAHHALAADGTHKLVVRLPDGQHIECVLIQEAGRH